MKSTHAWMFAAIAALGPGLAAAGCGNDLAKADEMLATGDFDGAAAIFQKRLDKNPEDGTGLIGMARVRYTQALEKSKGGKDTVEDWNAAVEFLEKAEVIDPAPKDVQPIAEDMVADGLLRAGIKRFEAGDHAGAADALAKAADKGSRAPELYVTLARAYHASNKGQEELKAAYRAAKADPGNVEFLREAAAWSTQLERPWMHHFFFYKAEQAKPAGFKFMRPVDITKMLTRKYGALNMINDTLGLFLLNEEVEPKACTGILEQEALIEDMEKFMGKKPPAAFDKKDRSRLHWVVYHYWNTTGVVFTYIGDRERARKWFDKAAAIEPKKIKHPDLSKDELEAEAGWAAANVTLL
jgi:tetratricopeptide (TPR) repeat protein